MSYNDRLFNQAQGEKVIELLCKIADPSGKLLEATKNEKLPGYTDRIFNAEQGDRLISRLKSITDLTPEDMINNFYPKNAGAHNSIFRGKFLGTQFTEEQSQSIRSGTFDDIFVGDYWRINDTIYRVADCDYLLFTTKEITSNSVTKLSDHHIVVIPDSIMYYSKMNNTATANDGYLNSLMHTTNLNEARDKFKLDFGESHILPHSENLSKQINSDGKVTICEYANNLCTELLSEIMIFGIKIKSPFNSIPGLTVSDIYPLTSQLSLFSFSREFIAESNKRSYYLRDISNYDRFCVISGRNTEVTTNLANAESGVRPFSLIY